MDSGLGVPWPLSPYATALAAGALVGFCVALWKHCSESKARTGQDPSGRESGRDLESKGNKDAEDKKRKEKERDRTNFLNLTFRDVNPGSLCASGNFGAIPRTAQRSRTLEAPHLFSALRRRNFERESKSWQELNSSTSNFSCIYQQSFCLGNEVPRLNARFVLNVSPYLNQYLRQFYQLRDFQVPEFTRKSEFENFDVSINPEILKDKPITRSAVCLTLEKQLHKILGGESFREVKISERAIQTASITEEKENCLEISIERNVPNPDLEVCDETNNDLFATSVGEEYSEKSNNISEENAYCEFNSKEEYTQNSNLEYCNDAKDDLFVKENSKKLSINSSLWDSGYCEKTFEEGCFSAKECDKNPKLLSVCCSERNYSDCASDVLNIAREGDTSSLSSDNYFDSSDIKNSIDKDLSSKLANVCVEKLDDAENTESSSNSDESTITCESIKNSNSERNMNVFLENELEETEIKNPGKEIINSSVVGIPEKTDVNNSNSETKLNLNIQNSSEVIENEILGAGEVLKPSIENICDDSALSEIKFKSSVKNIFQGVEDKISLPENKLTLSTKISSQVSSKNSVSEINLKSSTETVSHIKDVENTASAINSRENIQNSHVLNTDNLRADNNLFSSFKIFSSVVNIDSEITLKNKKIAAISDPAESAKDSGESENYLSLKSDLEEFQTRIPFLEGEENKSVHESVFRESENILILTKNQDYATRASGVDPGSAECEDKSIKNSEMNLANLEEIQSAPSDSGGEQNGIAPSPTLEARRGVLECDVTLNDSSRDPAVFDELGARRLPHQMDRETGERSVAVESSVTTETTLRDATRVSTAVVSRLTLDDWADDNSVSVKTTVSEEIFRPTYEEFTPLKSSEKISESDARRKAELIAFESCEKNGHALSSSDSSLPSSPRIERLKGLLNRDEERRARAKFQHLVDSDTGHVGGDREGEWDRLLRDVLASVSELERWERDVSADAEDAEEQSRHHPDPSQSDSSFSEMEEGGALLSPGKGETPTKIKSLRFKLDPDVFDVPSDDSFYDDDDDEVRRGWKKQPRYRAYSSLEVKDEPVRLVSVHASVVPAGQKMVARPVGIDLHVRLTEERQSKRAHVSTSPSQAKRRSPVSDRGVGWCQELSPVTENVDWRETFTPVNSECKTVPNGILKTPSPKTEPPPVESPNPFKLENGVTTNGVNAAVENKRVDKSKYNGVTPWRPVERKPFILPRKKFEPDPEAIERITGYKTALSKPPLPPPVSDKINATKIAIRKAELARKQYLDSKAALSACKADGMKKFQQFLNQAQDDRARIVTSVPDLAAIERAVTEQWMKEMKEKESVSPRESPIRENGVKADDATVSRGSTPDDKWASYVQSCRQHLGRRSQSMTYLETDIDIIPVLDEDDKCASTSALDEPDEALPDPDVSDTDRSREDLDDSGRAKSEHELRIERSLRSLPVPEWYRRSEKTKTGFLLGSSAKEKRGWAAAKSLASSTSSLASCGLRRPVRSLRSSRENIPWSRSSASPDGPTLSLALAKAFREPYLGWRARTPTSSGVSSSPRASPPSWGATTTDDEVNGVSFDGEDAFGRTTSSEDDKRDEPLSLDDTGADAVTVSMDTNDPVKLPGGEDTCDDINNMSMDTCELFDPASVVVPVDEDPSPQADTGDDIDNLSTDTTTTEGRKLDPKLKRYSYSQSIYHSEWEEEEESRGDRKVVKCEDRDQSSSSPGHKVVWIESSFVGSRTTTSIMVLPEKKAPTPERPASR